MSDIGTAFAIAWRAHAGQVDKEGQPYILHPVRVMLRGETPDERIAGLLHDVIEDGDVSPFELTVRGFAGRTVEAVVACTRRDTESYDQFIDRIICSGDLAIRVKLADVLDNLREPVPDHLRARYEKALGRLQAALEPVNGVNSGDGHG